VEVLRDGRPTGPRFGKVSRLPLRRDDVVRLVTGSGGGYGDPSERDPGLVAADLRDELITPAEATGFYGHDPSAESC
jgi:N-methylhydantoinase B